MSEEDLNTYKKYVSNFDITKYIVLDSESNYWYSAEYVDKMLKKQDKELERLNNIINRIKSIYSSLCFSAPENNYIFIEQLGEVLQELKGSDKE